MYNIVNHNSTGVTSGVTLKAREDPTPGHNII